MPHSGKIPRVQHRYSASRNRQKRAPRLLMQIIDQRRSQRPFVLAILLHVLPANGQDFLDELRCDEALQVVVHLLKMADRSDINLSDNRRRAACESLAGRIGSDGFAAFLKQWLSADQPKNQPVGMELLANFGRRISGDEFVCTLDDVSPAEITKLLDAICGCGGFPYGTELQLAISLKDHRHEEIRQWALGRVPSEIPTEVQPPRETSIATDLEPELAQQIESVNASGLERLLETQLTVPVRGLCVALAKRKAVASPIVCAAIIASRDSIELIDQRFIAFCNDDAQFLAKVDQQMVGWWLHCRELSMLGNAWLFRWEAHAFAFGEQSMKSESMMVGCLANAKILHSRVLAHQLWEAVAHTFVLYRARQPEHARLLLGDKLAAQLKDALSGDCGDVAAGMLAKLHVTGFAPEWLERIRVDVTSPTAHAIRGCPQDSESLARLPRASTTNCKTRRAGRTTERLARQNRNLCRRGPTSTLGI